MKGKLSKSIIAIFVLSILIAALSMDGHAELISLDEPVISENEPNKLAKSSKFLSPPQTD